MVYLEPKSFTEYQEQQQTQEIPEQRITPTSNSTLWRQNASAGKNQSERAFLKKTDGNRGMLTTSVPQWK
jgi:hypothetical protein